METVYFSLAELIRDNAVSHPESVAICHDERSVTWSELNRRSEHCALALLGEGVSSGDRVALLMKNAVEFYEALFACSKVGAAAVCLNWRLSSRELLDIIDDAGPRVLICDETANELGAGTDTRQADICRVFLGDQYESFLENASGEVTSPDSDPDDTLLVLYSSGTAGRPKGITLTNRNFSFIRRMATELLRMDPTSVYLLGSPLFHVGGVATGTALMTLGGRTVLLGEVDPDAILDVIEYERITHTFFVPSVIQRLVATQEANPRDLSSLRVMAYGAAPMTQALLRRAMAVLGCGFLGCYGMTETSGTVTALFPEEHGANDAAAKRLQSVGRALPWAEIRLVDPRTGSDAEVDAFGEIWIRSTANTPGYLNDALATSSAITDDGWLRTGDGASRDAEGFIYLKDRIKDMIISGGENVYPIEVENVLAEHPDIADAAVIGVPSARWGETVMAVVVAQAASALTAEEIIQFTRERLAHFKCPTLVELVSELPRTATGKVQKSALRKRYQ